MEKTMNYFLTILIVIGINLKEEWDLPGNDGGRLTIGLCPKYSLIFESFWN